VKKEREQKTSKLLLLILEKRGRSCPRNFLGGERKEGNDIDIWFGPRKGGKRSFGIENQKSEEVPQEKGQVRNNGFPPTRKMKRSRLTHVTEKR